jgi:hypothetical protein
MPKRQAEESGGEDVTSPQLKKAKASKSKSSAKPKNVVTKKSGETVKDADGNPYWEVGFFLSSPSVGNGLTSS